MKLIESSAQFIPQESGLEGIYKQIELAGRTCYKSEDKITHDSAERFVDRMIASHHTAMLEHGTIYLLFDCIRKEYLGYHGKDYEGNPYSKVHFWCDDNDADVRKYYITTNLRVLIENNWLDDLKYLCEPTEHHLKRYTFKFICDRGVSHELVRHRVFSFAQESTRYCNYSNDKFNRELTFIKPSWNYTKHIDDGVYEHMTDGNLFERFLECSQNFYNELITRGWTAQQARQVLPNAIKTEIVMTGFASDWRHFFDLRMWGKTGAPHPDMLELSTKAMLAAQDAGIWMSIEKQPSKFK